METLEDYMFFIKEQIPTNYNISVNSYYENNELQNNIHTMIGGNNLIITFVNEILKDIKVNDNYITEKEFLRLFNMKTFW